MKATILMLFILIPAFIFAQQNDRPRYCDDMPMAYEAVRGLPASSNRKPLPKFSTQPVVEYKVQVAILRNTDPSQYPFHESLVARWRPCEEVWVVESRSSFKSRAEADKLRSRLKQLGYDGAYITDLVAYE